MAARPPFRKQEYPPRPPFKRKELPPRPPFKKKEWPRKEEPSTIVNIKQPIAGRRKSKPVPPPHTPLKPAPRRSSMLKWNIKKR